MVFHFTAVSQDLPEANFSWNPITICYAFYSISPKRSVSQEACGAERTLRVPHIADLKKRLASVDGQRFDVILLIGAVHKIQAQTANIRMEQELMIEWSLSLYITCFITLWSMTPMLTVSR